MNESKMSYVKHSISEGIATLSFFHPKGNSFPSSHLKSLEKQIIDLGNEDKVKLIILRSEGDNVFSAGASFDELISLKSSSQAKEFFMGFANVILAMRSCPKFIVAAVEGKVVGGGVGLVSACDYAIATHEADIKLSELSIGIGPFVIEPAIRRKMGLNSVSELALNPQDWKSSEWAVQKGLYNKIEKSGQEFETKLNDFAHSLTQYSSAAMKDLKKIFWAGTEDWKNILNKRAEMSGELILSQESKAILNEIINK